MAAVEGDTVDLVVELHARTGAPQVEVEVDLPAALEPVDGTARRIVAAADGRVTTVRVPVRPTTWGVVAPRRVVIRCTDRFGLFLSSLVTSQAAPLRVHPSGARRRALLEPSLLRARLGVHLSAERGTGCEYADVRSVATGDTLRTVNWRVSARRGELWVNERHPERSADVVVLVDSIRAAGTSTASTLDAAVRAAVTLAERQHAVHDRVGVLALGSRVRWLAPGAGRRHLGRLVDAVLECEAEHTLSGPPLAAVPFGRLPSGALVVALTPLVTQRVAEVLLELRRRRHEVAVVLLDVEHRLPPPADVEESLATRLFLLDRNARVEQVRRSGAVVVPWDGDSSIDRVVGVMVGGRRARAVAGTRSR